MLIATEFSTLGNGWPTFGDGSTATDVDGCERCDNPAKINLFAGQ